ncbi:MAG TPA: paraquat-inducible protein A [Opitutaceae bacterium]|nr:paraquat-inducible protein A [Opitutaceae bacterium]
MIARAASSHPARLAQPTALALAALFMFVPANVLPILDTSTPGSVRTDTIFSGVVGLCEDGNWGIGAIVFAASILIPLLKLVGLAVLLWVARRGPPASPRRLTRLYAVLDVIGRWSMLDVFLVAFLAGLVQFGAFASVQPRSGIIAFAAVVVLTVMATDAFDPRWLWEDRRSTT